MRVHPHNRRYFTEGSGKAIYLTGSHICGNLCDYPPSQWLPFDYLRYLDFLGRYRYNFIHLWAGEALGSPPSRCIRARNIWYSCLRVGEVTVDLSSAKGALKARWLHPIEETRKSAASSPDAFRR